MYAVMDDAAHPPRETPPRRRRGFGAFSRRRSIALGVALVVLAALIALWSVRRPIAARVIDRELAKLGVPARYTIGTFGTGRQRLKNVVLGDPADPDLVADWLEAETRIGLDGAKVVGVRAGHVRLRARWVGGKLSFGAIDRLLPAPSGQATPFALPALFVDAEDARLRVETPAGVLGLKVSGRGRLDDGFAGNVALVGDTLRLNDCVASGVQAALRVTVTKGAPTVAGPVRLARGACGASRIVGVAADVDARLSPAFDAWRGSARLASAAVAGGGARAARLKGSATFDGNATATEGQADLAAAAVRAPGGAARTLAVRGRYRIGAEQLFAGTVTVAGGQVASRMLAVLDARTGAGSPVAPLVRQLSRALRQAGQAINGSADLAVRQAGGSGQLRVTRAALAAASGARLRLGGGSGIAYGWPQARVHIDTAVQIAGGGLPQADVQLAQARAGAPIRGRAIVAPYAAGGARLALAPVTFSAGSGGVTRITTRIDLSGPLGDGRIDGLQAPLDLDWDGRGRLRVDPGCVAVAIQRLAVAGLVLDPVRTRVCPRSGAAAVVTVERGRIGGGVRLPATRLTGRLGGTPLTLAASGSELRLEDNGFALSGVAARLGSPERVTRIDLGQLTGRIAGGGVAGQFAGGSGQIGNVPLLLGAAAGDWNLRGGVLALTGTMTVDDAAADPRFKTLAAREVTLRLADGTITAGGTLYEPTKSVKVADVRIVHRLSAGTGTADLTVPGIVFTKDFQPDLLTRLTFGVVAEVRATVTGDAHIGWAPEGVTSTGTFETKDAALAAAFGPVSGLSTTIHFSDLLSLASAPGQVATVKTINPGIAVTDGTIVYQLLPEQRVQIDSGVWPFAGGKMTLLPTTLDFAQAGQRRLTFRLDGVAADQFLQQFDFKNLDATGIFDGELPMIFDDAGGRIEGGRLTVRPGGGSIAYVGDLTQKDLGIWGNIAFQALKSLRYRNLTISMNGPLAGEMVTAVRFAGVTQGEGAKSNFIVRRLQKLPFVFNITIKAPFRGLLDSAQSFYDPSRLLPQLLERERRNGAIQPSASAPVPQPKQD
jgi:hypothetical protein